MPCASRPGVIESPGTGAEVAELADATDSKSVSRKGVWVRVPPSVLHTDPVLLEYELMGYAIGMYMVVTVLAINLLGIWWFYSERKESDSSGGH